jgi:hypothetical protein
MYRALTAGYPPPDPSEASPADAIHRICRGVIDDASKSASAHFFFAFSRKILSAFRLPAQFFLRSTDLHFATDNTQMRGE